MPKPFTPKPWGVGAEVDYEDRQGVVWSPGPVPASVWVQEDDGLMVGVKKPTKTRPARILDGRHRADKVRARIKRAEAVRSGVAVRSTTERTSADFRGMPTTSSWSVYVVHSSAECSEVDPQGAVVPGYPLGRVALRLVQDPTLTPATTYPRLCHCIPSA